MTDEALSFAERLQALLSHAGKAQLVYVTAEFEPFSGAQRPDIVFVPTKGGYAGQAIFIEIKVSGRPKELGRQFSALVEHRDFAAEALANPGIRYIFVTNAAVSEFSLKFLAERDIAVAERMNSEAETLEWMRANGFVA